MGAGCPPPPPPPCSGVLHTVATGETLESIAQSFAVTLQALVAANPQLITAGQVLCVPTAPSTCCLTLAPSDGAPAGAGGTAWVRQAPPDTLTALVAAVGLPPPGTFGPFTQYLARFVLPNGTSFQFPLSAAPSSPTPVLAGGTSVSVGPLPAATQVLVFPGTPAGAVGPVVLQGSLEACH